MLGKISAGMVFIVATGIGLIFGAAGIINGFNITGLETGCVTSAAWPP